MKVELGCGAKKKNGFYGIDIANLKGVDMVYNLNKGIPLKDNSVEEIYSSHCIEHLDDPMMIFQEIYRVLKKNGKAEIRLPHWSWWGSYTFMHKKFFNSNDFCFFEKEHPFHYYTENKFSFKIISRRLFHNVLTPKNFFNRSWNKFFNWILNVNLNLSENFITKMIAASEFKVILVKD